MRQYYKKHPEYRERDSKRVLNYYKQLRKQCKELIGNSCIICGSNKRLSFHEINGKKHMTHRSKDLKYYITHYQDFIPLCGKHHSMLHFIDNRVMKGLTKQQKNIMLELILKVKCE